MTLTLRCRAYLSDTVASEAWQHIDILRQIRITQSATTTSHLLGIDRVITHVAGDSIEVENMEIIVRVFGPEQKLLNEVRLINLPADSTTFCPDGVFAPNNFQGDPWLISQGCAPNQVLTSADSNTWSSGRTIQFQIRSSRADFSPGGGADELEVIIVHTPSKAIISEHVFRP